MYKGGGSGFHSLLGNNGDAARKKTVLAKVGESSVPKRASWTGRLLVQKEGREIQAVWGRGKAQKKKDGLRGRLHKRHEKNRRRHQTVNSPIETAVGEGELPEHTCKMQKK